MALGLNRITRSTGSITNGVTLEQILSDDSGFPYGYLPKVRIFNDEKYIATYGKGRDNDNMPVYYKWIFIDPTDNSATPDSDTEYAKIPEKGYIMRIVQRNLLPYHENFVIDYYEDINNLNIISCSDDQRNQWANRKKNVYRQFRIVNADISKSHVPHDLSEEIFSFPKEFFEKYLKDAIPAEMYWDSRINTSNHISSYGGIRTTGSTLDLGSRPVNDQRQRGFNRSTMMGGNNMNSRPQLDASAHRNRMTDAMNRINGASYESTGSNPSQYNQIDSPNSPIKRFSTW